MVEDLYVSVISYFFKKNYINMCVKVPWLYYHYDVNMFRVWSTYTMCQPASSQLKRSEIDTT